MREDKDLSQEKLCEYLNIKQRTYSDYERGKLDIPTALLIALADFHQTSIDYLLGRTDQKMPYPPRAKKRS
ncbi:helix-turn-helix domain-containing protein [Paenibacillus hodogayensis]|uniref:Helix-turn-helix domain-containing protein n=1 Tax=Paenibacillus hodogayensis TaxID=279208 RepID=A0ABV5VYN5_9BACL